MSLVTKEQESKPIIFENVRKKMEILVNQSPYLPRYILLIYGYIRICIENGYKDIIIPKSIIKFILNGLNALRNGSSELKPFWKSDNNRISLTKVVEAININNINRKRDKLVERITKILVRLVEANKNISYIENEMNNPFYNTIPSISINDYLKQISKWSQCSNDVFIMALIYIDRLIKTKNAMINNNTVHRYILISIMEAAKFQDDIHYNNKTYAIMGGITIQELNKLETHFLFSLQFDLNIKYQEVFSFSFSLFNKILFSTKFIIYIVSSILQQSHQFLLSVTIDLICSNYSVLCELLCNALCVQ